MLGHTLYAKQLNLEPRWDRHAARPRAGAGLFASVWAWLVKTRA